MLHLNGDGIATSVFIPKGTYEKAGLEGDYDAYVVRREVLVPPHFLGTIFSRNIIRAYMSNFGSKDFPFESTDGPRTPGERKNFLKSRAFLQFLTGKNLEGLLNDVHVCLQPCLSLLHRHDAADTGGKYIQGLLSRLPRKSAER